MRWLAAVMAVVILAGMGGVVRGVGAEIDMGGVKDARADLEAGKYPECLRRLAKLLAHTSALEKTKERGMLLAMRGECLLQQKQAPEAADAFDGAASSYPAKEKKEAGLASATSELIRKSVDFHYVPKTGTDKTPLPIVDLKGRPAAFTALFTDQMAADQDAVKPLTQGTASLSSIVGFAPELEALDNLETAGTGSDTQTAAMAKELADSAKKSMDAWIAASNKETDTISTDAARMVTTATGSGSNRKETTKPRGIMEWERTNLNTILTTAEKMPGTIKTLAEALSPEADYFKKEGDDAQALATKVEGVLKTAK